MFVGPEIFLALAKFRFAMQRVKYSSGPRMAAVPVCAHRAPSKSPGRARRLNWKLHPDLEKAAWPRQIYYRSRA
jgi:hypothetical protein